MADTDRYREVMLIGMLLAVATPFSFIEFLTYFLTAQHGPEDIKALVLLALVLLLTFAGIRRIRQLIHC
jgi:purine-cytosine permease-like protein